METFDFRLGFFDLFGHIVPGAIMLFAIILPFDDDIDNFKSLYAILSNVNIMFVVVYLFLSYVISAIFQQVGYFWFKRAGKIIYLYEFVVRKIDNFYKSLSGKDKLNKEDNVNGEVELINEDYSKLDSYIRQFSQSNAILIGEWVAKRAMCFNLSLGLFWLMVSVSIKSSNHTGRWYELMTLLLFSSLSLLSRAREYNKWYHNDIYNTIRLIEKEKGIKILATRNEVT